MFCDFNAVDWTLELAWQAAHIVDAKQTLKIARNPDKYQELSAQHLIGAHPNTTKVLMFFAATSIGHFALTCDLTSTRRLWGMATLAEKARIVLNNQQLGIHLSW